MIFHDINTIIQFIIEVDNSSKIIFFIENLSHYRFVKPLLKHYLDNKSEIQVVYLEYPFDEDLSKFSNLDLLKINDNIEKIKILKNLKGQMFITTTPSIGSPIFPKSSVYPKSDRPFYVYLFHSLVSPNEMYVKNSFKNFDIILSPSEVVTSQLKNLTSKKTQIFTSGYLMFNDLDVFKYKSNFKEKVLLAPTWGTNAVEEIIKSISSIIEFNTNLGYETVFRPHPMTNLNNIKIDSEITIDNNLDLTDLHEYSNLITDFSGIALEYFYMTGRSTLFLDVEKKIKRKIKKNENRSEFLENIMRKTIGNVTTIENLKNLKGFPQLDNDESIQFASLIRGYKNSLERSLSFLSKATGS